MDFYLSNISYIMEYFILIFRYLSEEMEITESKNLVFFILITCLKTIKTSLNKTELFNNKHQITGG